MSTDGKTLKFRAAKLKGFTVYSNKESHCFLQLNFNAILVLAGARVTGVSKFCFPYYEFF